MALNTAALIAQIDRVLARYDEARATSRDDSLKGQPYALHLELVTGLVAVIDRLAPPNSEYRRNLKTLLDRYGPDNSYLVGVLPGLVRALRADLLAGDLQTVQELVHAEVFAEFLEMAEHLLDQGFKDPAAVLVGGVLEEHLRKLCDRHDIGSIENGRPKKAERMNTELAAVAVYSKLDQKSVTAWLDLRNKSAHGRYDEYAKEQVDVMLNGVRDFVSRTPA
jgi:hypothetical protein